MTTTSDRPGRWTDHERAVIVRALLDGQTAEQCAAQLTYRSAEAVRRCANQMRVEGATLEPPVVLPEFPRKSSGPDWGALREIVEGRTARDRTGEV